jgi:hypothetical protein
MKTTIAALILIVMSTGCAGPLERAAREEARNNKADVPYWQKNDVARTSGEAKKELTPEQKQVADQKDKDMAVCRYEATKATASSETGYSMASMLFNDTTNTFKQAELITLCMKSKGWVG